MGTLWSTGTSLCLECGTVVAMCLYALVKAHGTTHCKGENVMRKSYFNKEILQVHGRLEITTEHGKLGDL